MNPRVRQAVGALSEALSPSGAASGASSPRWAGSMARRRRWRQTGQCRVRWRYPAAADRWARSRARVSCRTDVAIRHLPGPPAPQGALTSGVPRESDAVKGAGRCRSALPPEVRRACGPGPRVRGAPSRGSAPTAFGTLWAGLWHGGRPRPATAPPRPGRPIGVVPRGGSASAAASGAAAKARVRCRLRAFPMRSRGDLPRLFAAAPRARPPRRADVGMAKARVRCRIRASPMRS